jgi:hypothetical protein
VKKIIQHSLKDESGSFIKPDVPPEERDDPDLSIDTLLTRGLNTIDRVMKLVSREVSTGVASRESVMNLKDCMLMLHDLKEKEQELLESLSDAELESSV